MAYVAYRVRKSFGWDGWMFAPSGKCKCAENFDCGACTKVVGTSCHCHDTSCHCDCGIRSDQYAGDIWLVPEGDELRKEMMLAHRFATGDASIRRVKELMEDPHYQAITQPRKIGTLV